MLRASSQRRRLALLALVAASGSSGISRDKVLAYLWPSTDNEHARHSLAQLIYSMRHALGCNLIEGESEFQIDRATLTSDIGEFMEASGDQLVMSQIYAGPFLDGFHLNDSVEFSHWADRVRERTTAMACAALEGLAHAASLRGDYAQSIATWRVRVGLDPLDAGPSMALMEALAAAGDRAGSIRHAQAYQKLIRNELDMEADPRVSALANRFRRETPSEGTAALRNQSSPGPDLLASLDTDEAATQGAVQEIPEAVEEPPKRRRPGVSKVVAAFALSALGVAAALWSRKRANKRSD